MENFRQRLGVFPVLLLGSALLIIGMMTLDHIVNNWWPIDVERVDLIRDTTLDRIESAALLEAANPDVLIAFLGAILVTATGVSLPLAHFLNQRFGRETRFPPFLVTLRQAMWVGLWAAVCTWLQMNRAFGVAIAALVGGVFILFEVWLQIQTQVSKVAR